MEAQLWVQYCLEDGGVLEDPAVDYLAERVDEMDAAALLEAMELLQDRLRKLQPSFAERIRITRDYRDGIFAVPPPSRGHPFCKPQKLPARIDGLVRRHFPPR